MLVNKIYFVEADVVREYTVYICFELKMNS